ncbi:MAG: TlpA family protein disulfide reductase [Chloroflexi bacterium]|nr:TlpA family protein disulfide reductase [Chloroflexota bacterium]
MMRKDVRIGVPTERATRKGRAFGLRDVLVTLGIALLIVGVVFAFNRSKGLKEGSFVSANVLAGGLAAGPAPTLGKAAPDFEVPLLNGETFRLNEHRGHVVWINFWATWCPPCRAEMPDIEQVWRSEQGSDLVIVAVDYAETTAKVQAFVDKLGLTFPIALDRDGQVGTQYRLAGFPSHFFVDRQGILREVRVGLLSEATMRATLQKLRSY